MNTVKQPVPPKVQEAFDSPLPPVDSVRTEYYVFMEDGKWSGVCPALEGVEVKGLSSAAAVRNALSTLIGRIGSAYGMRHEPMPWKTDARFDPPQGAIKRHFVVGNIAPARE